MGYEVIKTLAKEKRISLETIANYAGLSYNSLSKIIRNTVSEPKFTTMKAIAHALGMSTDELAVAVGLSSASEAPDSIGSKITITVEPHKTAIQKYLSLNPEHQANIRGMIDGYAFEEQNSEKRADDTEFSKEMA